METTLKSVLLNGLKLHPLPRVHYIAHDSPALASLQGDSGSGKPSPAAAPFPFYYLSLFPEAQLGRVRLAAPHCSSGRLAQLPLSFFAILPREKAIAPATPVPTDFTELTPFVACLHHVLLANLLGDTELVAQARVLDSGWLHIHDERAPVPQGRIPDPQDIFASVRVQHGQLLTDTYAPMPTYRLVTRDGRFKLKRNYLEALESYLRLR